jgi:hypothetical protein
VAARNTGSSAFNSSSLNLLINGRQKPSSNSPTIVNPQETLNTEINSKVRGDEEIIYTNGDISKKFKCSELPSGYPVRLLSIGHGAAENNGGNAPTPPDGGTYGGIYYGYNNSEIPGTNFNPNSPIPVGRGGYTVAAYDRSSENWIGGRYYSLPGDGPQLVNDLTGYNNSYGDEATVIIVGTKEPQEFRKQGSLDDLVLDMGASKEVYGASDSGPPPFKNASSYVLVGSPGLSEGEAYLEEYRGRIDNDENAYVDVDYEIEEIR